MAYKRSGHKVFRCGNFSFNCFSQGTRYGFRHVCDVVNTSSGESFRVTCAYYNRTWESFRYASVLRKAADRLPAEDRAAMAKYINLLAEEEHARCTGKFEKFREEWQRLPESMKNALRHMAPVETEEEADRITAIAAMYNIITGK
jgi:hypothetical protein